MNRRTSYAEQMKLGILFHGFNRLGQWSFGSGPLVTDVFNTAEEAVKKFGDRIQPDRLAAKHSPLFAAGKKMAAAGKFTPPDKANGDERTEYGHGYLAGLVGR